MKRSRNAAVRTLSVAAAGLVLAACFSQAGAQVFSVTPRKGDDFRAVYANAADIAEGKTLGESNCARCHGAEGVSKTPGIPHIAGQRAAYLYAELVAYKSGQRSNQAMASVVRFLSDEALVKVSAYFSSLPPPAPAPQRGAIAAAAKGSIMKSDKAATAACAGCHGETGVSQMPGMPSLVGQDPKYLAAAIGAYKKGQRKNDMMKSMVASLDEAAIKNISLFYALQKAARAKTPAKGDKTAGKAAAASCTGCHGEQGVSGNPATPSLAGQDAEYFAVALRAYKSGERADPTMSGIAGAMDDKTIRNLAAYYASLTPKQPPNVRVPLTPAQWATRCDRCHGVDGNSMDPRTPALAAQRFDYLEQVLRQFQTGARKSTTMAAMADMLSGVDVGALAAHYASQRARPVVYVTLPCK